MTPTYASDSRNPHDDFCTVLDVFKVGVAEPVIIGVGVGVHGAEEMQARFLGVFFVEV